MIWYIYNDGVFVEYIADLIHAFVKARNDSSGKCILRSCSRLSESYCGFQSVCLSLCLFLMLLNRKRKDQRRPQLPTRWFALHVTRGSVLTSKGQRSRLQCRMNEVSVCVCHQAHKLAASYRADVVPCNPCLSLVFPCNANRILFSEVVIAKCQKFSDYDVKFKRCSFHTAR